ncbi:MAG: LPS-assembly protein LptD [Pseudomonadota bacterium]
MPPFARLILPLCLAAAFADAHADQPLLNLRPSGQISGPSPKAEPAPGPTHIEADKVEGHKDKDVVAEGHVIMRNLRESLEADWLRYDEATDEAEARGKVVLIRDKDRLEGSHLKLKLTQRLGTLQDVRYEVYSDDGRRARGEARTLTFAGVDRYEFDQASYTSCPAGNQDWILKTGDLKLDYVSRVGQARQVHVEFLDVPILYTPWMDFSLDDSRKTGLLAPTYGVSVERGLELMVPWYWNIAPNRDATLMPRLMTKRGLQLGGEFRYLEPAYGGELNLEYLANDQVANRNRFRTYWKHGQDLGGGWSGKVEYERVSDDAYFSDLSSQVSQTSRVNLPEQASLSYDGGWWQASGMVQKFQTLQDPANPIVDPYHRLPRLGLTAQRENVLGVERARFDLAGEYVYFDHPTSNRVQGSRLHVYPSLAVPFETTFSSVTPRLGWHLTHYRLDDASRMSPDSVYTQAQVNGVGGYADDTRSVPVFSLDATLLMERETRLFSSAFIQTLEPRLFYVYAPYRNQDRIPVFDSSLSDLSLDQLFSENQFTGVDRFNDANQVTLALTSRFLEQETGVERLQVTFGQRYYFEDQRVGLTPTAAAGVADTTDLIAQVSGQITNKWRLTSGVQVSTNDGSLVKANFGGAYRDGPGRVFNADYRYTQNALNQIDLSAQWPLAPKWYGVGRLNYSIEDKRLVEGLAGFEYNPGCWSLRGVLQRLATTENTATRAFFLQLEMRGLTKLGPNPLEVLKRSITGYAKSDEFNLP